MSLVVCDTSFLLPAWFSPRGRRRKVLITLAYGALSYYARVGAEELDLLRQEEARGEVRIGGPPIEELVSRAAARKARLEEFIPLAPDDFVLVTSRVLLDEFERKAKEVGPRLAPSLPPNAAEIARRGIEAVTGYVIPDFALDDVPLRTAGRDRDDDFLIETALRSGAEIVLSDDRRHVALHSHVSTRYRGPGGQVTEAYQLDLFVESLLNSLHFDIDEVDPQLLGLALED
jgi:predicted nucleic acid-binding protein